MQPVDRLEIKYRCLHPSCCVNCREGYLWMDSDAFNASLGHDGEKDSFRSPRGICRMGFRQPFRAVKVEVMKAVIKDADEAGAEPDLKGDPIAILMNEHRLILKTLDRIEEHLRKRDVDALWTATKEIENDLNLHSGTKEEDVVLPVLSEILPLGEGLVTIIKEDHREILSLLHAFRGALKGGDINDGVIGSMIVSLRGHIRKEDNEFFALVEKGLDDEAKKRLVDGMNKVEREFVREPAGERLILTEADRLEIARRNAMNEDALDLKDLTNSGCCH